jgi:hypothetical protein
MTGLKSQPKRKNNTFIQIRVDDQSVTDPENTADVFANNFKPEDGCLLGCSAV